MSPKPRVIYFGDEIVRDTVEVLNIAVHAVEYVRRRAVIRVHGVNYLREIPLSVFLIQLGITRSDVARAFGDLPYQMTTEEALDEVVE